MERTKRQIGRSRYAAAKRAADEKAGLGGAGGKPVLYFPNGKPRPLTGRGSTGRHNAPPNSNRDDEIIARYERHEQVKDIARACGIRSKRTVYDVLRRHEIPIRAEVGMAQDVRSDAWKQYALEYYARNGISEPTALILSHLAPRNDERGRCLTENVSDAFERMSAGGEHGSLAAFDTGLD